MQVSPRRLLPREAVPGRGKVRGTRTPAGGMGQLSVLLEGGCLCGLEPRTAVGCVGDGVRQSPASASPLANPDSSIPGQPSVRPLPSLAVDVRLGCGAARGSCLAALRHLPPAHRPVPPGRCGAPLAFYKGAKRIIEQL